MGRSSLIVFILFQFLLLLPLSQSCQRKHLKGFLDGNKDEPQVHHHNYHHHYDKDGNEIPPPPYPHPPDYGHGPYYGNGVEQVTQIDGDEPAKHVVVLQPAPVHTPAEENFFDSIIPKKFHPKHIFKHHVHKLRDRFRDLLGDKKEKVHAKFHHHHGKHQHKSLPPPAHYYQGGHPGRQVAVPALKVPLVQVEAYKPAPYHPHYHQHHPGGGPKAVAYVSPDGYQPAVVVKQRPHHYVERPPPPPAPGPSGPPPPQPVEYEYQYEHPKSQPVYQPQTVSVPAEHAYHHPQTHSQPQVQHVTYTSQDDSYHQHEPQSVPVYGPKSQHSYKSYGPTTSYQHFGHGPTSSSTSHFSSSPFSSESSGFADSSSLYQ